MDKRDPRHSERTEKFACHILKRALSILLDFAHLFYQQNRAPLNKLRAHLKRQNKEVFLTTNTSS